MERPQVQLIRPPVLVRQALFGEGVRPGGDRTFVFVFQQLARPQQAGERAGKLVVLDDDRPCVLPQRRYQLRFARDPHGNRRRRLGRRLGMDDVSTMPLTSGNGRGCGACAQCVVMVEGRLSRAARGAAIQSEHCVSNKMCPMDLPQTLGCDPGRAESADQNPVIRGRGSDSGAGRWAPEI